METNFKGTKGKWVRYKATPLSLGEPIKHSVYIGTKRIALCYNLFEYDTSLNTNEKEAEYNALLISKAPEMLEMLIKCERTLREVYEVDTLEVKQLIKKATEPIVS